jgi:hypothetical protein
MSEDGLSYGSTSGTALQAVVSGTVVQPMSRRQRHAAAGNFTTAGQSTRKSVEYLK